MQRLILFMVLCFAGQFANSQVAKTTVVEHFTNSNCGVCAYYNPFIFDTLDNYPTVLRIAFYPSAPYVACFFSMQNPADNDARTNFYGVYGGTPKLLLNGSLTTTPALDSTLQSCSGDSSAFEVKTKQQYITPDSVRIEVVIKKVAADTQTYASIFVAATEDTVWQLTGNGESVHRDVFRKAMTQITGDFVALPAAINDSLLLYFNYAISNNWNASRMQTIAILQDPSNKQVINASRSLTVSGAPLAVSQQKINDLVVYPNPVADILYFSDSGKIAGYELISPVGRVLKRSSDEKVPVDMSDYASGYYLLKLTLSDGGQKTQVIFKN